MAFDDSVCHRNKQRCGSGSVLVPYSGALWIRIRILNMDPDIHMKIKSEEQLQDLNIIKIIIFESSEKKGFFEVKNNSLLNYPSLSGGSRMLSQSWIQKLN